jgi:hypothetical protein
VLQVLGLIIAMLLALSTAGSLEEAARSILIAAALWATSRSIINHLTRGGSV